MKPSSTPAPAALAAPDLLPSPKGHPWWRAFATKRFLFLSVVLHLVLAVVAAIWIVQIVRPDRHQNNFTSSPSGSVKAATRALEHQVKMVRHQDMMSAPPALKRVVSLGPSKMALPAFPGMPASLPVAPSTITGIGDMPTAGFGSVLSGGGNVGGGGGFTNFIGGLRITSRKLGVALDVSGSVRAYQQEMHEYVAKVFKGSQVLEFSTAGFITVKSARGSMGQDVLEFLNSPGKFDAIYIFSDFGETEENSRGRSQDLWPQVQQLILEKKVKLYLHVLRKPGDNRINPTLYKVIQFAKNTGGAVEIGEMTHLDEGNTSDTAEGTSPL